MIPTLKHLLETKRVPQALLLVGKNLRKQAEAFALAFLETTKSSHPDLHQVYPEGKSDQHPLASLKKLLEDAALSPYQGHKKVFLIHEAEKMLPTSGNVLLKTIEEPTFHTLFLLTAPAPEKILPTLLSRCQVVIFPPEEVTLASQLGVDFILKKFPADHFQENGAEIFESILLFFRDRVLLEVGGAEAYLTFPERKEEIRAYPCLSLEAISSILAKGKLAFERSIKLPLCLEMMALQIEALPAWKPLPS